MNRYSHAFLQLHPRCCAMPRCNFQPSLLQLQEPGIPANYNFNSTPVTLHLHPCRSATPPLSLCNPEGGLPLVFGMLHGHTSLSCILSTFAIRTAIAAGCKWLRWPWRTMTPHSHYVLVLICVQISCSLLACLLWFVTPVDYDPFCDSSTS